MVENLEGNPRPKRSVRIKRAQNQTVNSSNDKASSSTAVSTSQAASSAPSKAVNTRSNVNANKATPQSSTRTSARKANVVNNNPSTSTTATSTSAKGGEKSPVTDSVIKNEEPKQMQTDEKKLEAELKSENHNSNDDMDEKNKKNVRRSTRDIKRPKFDDEIIDPSGAVTKIISPKKAKTSHEIVSGDESLPPAIQIPALTGAKKRPSISSTSSKVAIKPETAESEPPTRESTPPLPKSEPKMDIQISDTNSQTSQQPKRKRTRPENKAANSKLNNKIASLIYDNPIHQGIVDEIIKKWDVEDDIMLMAAVHHLCDLQAVLAQTKFSKSMTLSDLDERWYLMLYDEKVSKLITSRISNQPKVVIEKVHRKIPFSMEEDRMIQNSDAGNNATIEIFEKLIQSNKNLFPLWRTPDVLLQRWNFLKHETKAEKNTEQKNGGIAQIHDEIEQNLDFCNLAQKDVPTDIEQGMVPRDLNEAEKQYNELRKAPHEAIAGTTLSPQMPPNVLAQLRGCCVSFNIVSPYVVIGRSTDQFAVDVNLAYEGPCQRVSRAQAVLKLNENDEFILYNTGRNPVYADKKVVNPKQKTIIKSNTAVEFGLISLLFLRNETARRTATSLSSSTSPLSNNDERSNSTKPSVIVSHL